MDINEQCQQCIRLDRHWNPSLRTAVRGFYNSHKDKTGFEIGCSQNCPFLKESMKVLG
jgi:hypothetical protein